MTRAELVAELRAKAVGNPSTVRHVRPAWLTTAADLLEADGALLAAATDLIERHAL
jgi:hypothetical protein